MRKLILVGEDSDEGRSISDSSAKFLPSCYPRSLEFPAEMRSRGSLPIPRVFCAGYDKGALFPKILRRTKVVRIVDISAAFL